MYQVQCKLNSHSLTTFMCLYVCINDVTLLPLQVPYAVLVGPADRADARHLCRGGVHQQHHEEIQRAQL